MNCFHLCEVKNLRSPSTCLDCKMLELQKGASFSQIVKLVCGSIVYSSSVLAK